MVIILGTKAINFIIHFFNYFLIWRRKGQIVFNYKY